MTSNWYEGKRVMVAGGTGTIGMQVCKILHEKGANVFAVGLDNMVYAEKVLPNEVPYTIQDLTDFNTCLLLTKGVDVVFDLTGIKGSTVSNSKNYSRMFVNYLRFQTNLMDACAKNDVESYLFAGSQCEYPRMERPKREQDMWNDSPQQNDKYSGWVKRVGELQAQTYYDEGSWRGAKIVRLANVYGPGDDFNPQTAQVVGALIGRVVDAMERGETNIPVNGDGGAIRDLLFSVDAAHWCVVAAEKLPPCTPVNIGHGYGVSIRYLTRTLNEIAPQIKFVFDGSAYSGDPVRILDTTLTKRLLGWYERTPFEQGIQKTFEWYVANKDVANMKGKFYGK